MMHIDLPRQVDLALALLEQNNHEAFLVGGSVRDALLKLEPRDYDIATSATPGQILALFNRYPTYKAGQLHGTIGVVIDGLPMEITTYRTGMTDKKTWAKTLREDLSHRDFTINALAYHPRRGVVDYFKGKNDLASRTIRCVGDPDERFREDGLRVLRALRFASEYGFSIAPATVQSLYRNKNLLRSVAPERLATELARLVCGDHVRWVLLEHSAILGVIIPEILPTRGFRQHHHYHIYDIWTHTAHVVGHTPALLPVRLAALFHDLGKPDTFTMDAKGVGHFYGHGQVSATMARNVLRRLRFDRATTDRVCQLVLHHDVPVPTEEKKVKRWLHKLSEPALRELLMLKKADILAQNPAYAHHRLDGIEQVNALIDRIVDQKQCYSLADLAVGGQDLIELGIPRGTDVGRILNELLDAVMEGKLPNEKNVLLESILHKRGD